MGPFVIYRIVQTSGKMLEESGGYRHIIVIGNLFIQDRGVSGLADISRGTGNEPERIIIESASYIGITLLGKWLILVIGPSGNWVEAMSIILCLALSGIRCTNPRRS